eukprot:UN14426
MERCLCDHGSIYDTHLIVLILRAMHIRIDVYNLAILLLAFMLASSSWT